MSLSPKPTAATAAAGTFPAFTLQSQIDTKYPLSNSYGMTNSTLSPRRLQFNEEPPSLEKANIPGRTNNFIQFYNRGYSGNTEEAKKQFVNTESSIKVSFNPIFRLNSVLQC